MNKPQTAVKLGLPFDKYHFEGYPGTPTIFINHGLLIRSVRYSEYLLIAPGMSANPSWATVPRYTTKPQTLLQYIDHYRPYDFISHISVLIFAGTALQKKSVNWTPSWVADFLETMFRAVNHWPHPFTKYLVQMRSLMNFGWNPELDVWRISAKKQQIFLWAEYWRLRCNKRKYTLKLMDVYGCLWYYGKSKIGLKMCAPALGFQPKGLTGDHFFWARTLAEIPRLDLDI